MNLRRKHAHYEHMRPLLALCVHRDMEYRCLAADSPTVAAPLAHTSRAAS